MSETAIKNPRATVLLCNLWDAPRFVAPEKVKGSAIAKAVEEATNGGVEQWQE